MDKALGSKDMHEVIRLLVAVEPRFSRSDLGPRQLLDSLIQLAMNQEGEPKKDFPTRVDDLFEQALSGARPGKKEALWKKAINMTGMNLSVLPQSAFGLYAEAGRRVHIQDLAEAPDA